MLPYAYTYPRTWRHTRDLLRRRHRLVSLRAEANIHIQATFKQQGILDNLSSIIYNKKERKSLVERFTDSDLQMTIASDLDVMDSLDPIIYKIERKILKAAKLHDPKMHALLSTVPGIGPIISFTLLYEIYDINRFSTVQKFSSYAGLVRCERESAGKNTGSNNTRKVRNPYLKDAFSGIILGAQVGSPKIKKYYERLMSKHGKKKALAIMAHKFGVAVYFMFKNGEAFDEDRFVNTK